MVTRHVRAHATGVPFRDDELLVERYERSGGFYRPIGGGIEFGEASDDAIVREFREETGLAVEPAELLGVVENAYTFEGTPGHEITFLYEVTFADESVYDREVITVEEAGDDPTRTASWQTLEELLAGDAPLYPEGVERVLRGDTDHLLSV